MAFDARLPTSSTTSCISPAFSLSIEPSIPEAQIEFINEIPSTLTAWRQCENATHQKGLDRYVKTSSRALPTLNWHPER